MKMFKWGFLAFVLMVIVGYVANTPCMAVDMQTDGAVITDDEQYYDPGRDVDPGMEEEQSDEAVAPDDDTEYDPERDVELDSDNEGDMYDNSNDQGSDEEYTEPETEPQEETY